MNHLKIVDQLRKVRDILTLNISTRQLATARKTLLEISDELLVADALWKQGLPPPKPVNPNCSLSEGGYSQ